MKLFYIGFILLFSNLVHAGESKYIEYQCTFTVKSEDRNDFIMKGILRLDAKSITDTAYLTLEPPMISGIPFSARILLSRYESEDYFPMSIHPRGDTVRFAAMARLDHSDYGYISHHSEGVKYSLHCNKL